MMSAMSKEERMSLQSELAAALAAGKSCAEWASANGVSERTAQRWASESEVRAEVEEYRSGLGTAWRRDPKMEAIADPVRLEHMSDRILDAKSWDELINGA